MCDYSLLVLINKLPDYPRGSAIEPVWSTMNLKPIEEKIMAKNQVQFQKGISLPQFLKQYGTEEQCRNALFQWRWPGGFICPVGGHAGHCELSGRSVYQCHCCHRQTSVTSGTIFEYTKLPLTTWFLGIYLLTQLKKM